MVYVTLHSIATHTHTMTCMHPPPPPPHTHRSKEVAVSTGSLVVSLHPAVTRRHHNMAATKSLCLHHHPLHCYHPLHQHIFWVRGRVEDHHVSPSHPPPPHAPPVHPRDVLTPRRWVESRLRCRKKEGVASFRIIIQNSYFTILPSWRRPPLARGSRRCRRTSRPREDLPAGRPGLPARTPGDGNSCAPTSQEKFEVQRDTSICAIRPARVFRYASVHNNYVSKR